MGDLSKKAIAVCAGVIAFLVFASLRMLGAPAAPARARDAAPLDVLHARMRERSQVQLAEPGLQRHGPFCRSHIGRANKYFDDFQEDNDPDTKYFTMDKPLVFLDPINCRVSSTSFKGVKWFREEGYSNTSNSKVRGRSLALVVADTAGAVLGKRIKCLTEVRDLSILNTEAKGAIHDTLKSANLKRYVATEYLNYPNLHSGDLLMSPNNRMVRHEDLLGTSFENDSFDIIISTEVFEHIPHPYQAHREIYRILKRGGAHVFTNPFLSDRRTDLVASSLTPDGKIVHHVEPPIFHHDPMRPKGVLVFTLFGWELVTKLCDIGFDVDVVYVRNPKYGIIGKGSYHFIAWKT